MKYLTNYLFGNQCDVWFTVIIGDITENPNWNKEITTHGYGLVFTDNTKAALLSNTELSSIAWVTDKY